MGSEVTVRRMPTGLIDTEEKTDQENQKYLQKKSCELNTIACIWTVQIKTYRKISMSIGFIFVQREEVFPLLCYKDN